MRQQDSDGRLPVRDIVAIQDRFYILATSSMAEEQSRVLKNGETFVVFDRYGDIKPVGFEGVYHEGTRYLSSLLLRLEEERPLLLSSKVKEDNAHIAVDLTNADVYGDGALILPRGILHILRTQVLLDGLYLERLSVRNYGLAPVDTHIMLHVAADYADIFEVRGMRRDVRGHCLPSHRERDALVLAYRGLDDVVRRTTIAVQPAPAALGPGFARLDVRLAPDAEVSWEVAVACELGDSVRPVVSVPAALEQVIRTLRRQCDQTCAVCTSNEPFNDWINRSLADLAMMTSETAEGPYPYAGVPWFSAPFGRDGIITALEVLWTNPMLARGVLQFLAATQAESTSVEQDAQPGKILHEMRRGEMAALGEIPFARYYGSQDATPLFVMLAAAYYARTADRAFIERLWPSIARALRWIDEYGDVDGDGFVEYERRSPTGLVHQGWKDSHDAVFHDDGRLAEPPIALCEVQGYVYAAWRGAAALMAMLGDAAAAARLEARAGALRRRFDAAFWCEGIGTYALALDGQKRPCRVRTSNAGQCLFTEIALPDRARRVAAGLLSESGFSGWGVRTVASDAARYNPMSYHNGSVWLHDNALIAHGLSRYSLQDDALVLLGALFDVSVFVPFHRQPELFCGFTRRPGESPTLYPVACAPQAWAAGAPFLLLQACLGLEIDAPRRQVRFQRAVLPTFLHEVRLTGLRVGGAELDLLLTRHDTHVVISVLRRRGDVEVLSFA
jgi:glycogen debranching enzyme